MSSVWPWPDPRPDPPVEAGEDRDSHLLPNLERLRRMSRADRLELVALVEDWRGPVVEEFRRRVAELNQ